MSTKSILRLSIFTLVFAALLAGGACAQSNQSTGPVDFEGEQVQSALLAAVLIEGNKPAAEQPQTDLGIEVQMTPGCASCPVGFDACCTYLCLESATYYVCMTGNYGG